MDSEPRVTEADRKAAERFMAAYAATEPYLGRHSDQTKALALAIAAIRQAALIEGARVGLEAVAKTLDKCCDPCPVCVNNVEALDPAAIIAQYLEKQG